MSQEINTVFCHDGQEHHFDVREAEDMGRFERALEVLGAREKETPKTGKASEMLKHNADMIKEFFDNCLGSGAGAAVFTEKSNVGLCYDAYMAFIDMVNQHPDERRIPSDTPETAARLQIPDSSAPQNLSALLPCEKT